MIAAIENGFPQREIADASYRYQREVETGDKIVVGVNGFQSLDEEPIEILQIDQKAHERQVTNWRRCGRGGTGPRWTGRSIASGARPRARRIQCRTSWTLSALTQRWAKSVALCGMCSLLSGIERNLTKC